MQSSTEGRRLSARVMLGTAALIACSGLGAQDATERFAEHSRLFPDRTVELPGKNIWVFQNALGFASNIAVIEGLDGLVFVDTGVTVTHARAVLDRVRRVSAKPVAGIVYTHHHMDHIGGASVLLDGRDARDVKIIAAANFIAEHTNENLTTAPIWSLRAVYQFGTVLTGSDAAHYHLGCCGPFRNDGSASFVEPNTLVEDDTELVVAGIRMRLFRMGGESPTALGIYLPDRKVAFVGDEIQGPTFPQLHAPRGTKFRDPNRWITGLDVVRGLDLEDLVPSHGPNFRGAAEITRSLTAYRDAIQYTHDQAIRFINKGLDQGQLAERLQGLPSYLVTPITGEYYGTVASSVRNLYTSYISWFSGDAVDIDPLPSRESASRMLALLGGRDRVLEEGRGALDRGDYQWAAELATIVIRAGEDAGARRLKARALRALGERTTSSTFRSWYFTSAMELEGDVSIGRAHARWLTMLLSDANLAQLSAGQLLEQLRYRVNADVAGNTAVRVRFLFTDSGDRYSAEIRHSILEISSGTGDAHDAVVEMPRTFLGRLLRGEETYARGVATGVVSVVEGKPAADLFFSSLDFGSTEILLNGAK